MRVSLVDFLSIDDAKAGVKKTKDGYLVANPRIARHGIQLYRGSELGIKDKAVVRVWRPEEEVFSKDAVASLTHRPLTNDHPPVPVTAENWKKYATGQFGDEAMKDGDFLRVPMVMMDSAAIADYDAGKRQLSVGYSCDLVIESGTVPDGAYKGQAYDAIQRGIRGNHIAQCKAARGGERLAIGDAGADDFGKSVVDAENFDLMVGATIARVAIQHDKRVKHDEITDEAGDMFLGDGYPFGKGGFVYVSLLKSTRQRASDKGNTAVHDMADKLLKLIDDDQPNGGSMPKIVIIDGVSVTFDNEQSAQIAERAIADRDNRLKTQATDHTSALAGINTKLNETTALVTTLTKDKDTLTAENATLKQQVKDAEITPAKLDALVADRLQTFGKAKVLLGDKLVTDGKTVAEVQRQVVDAKLGAVAKDWTPEQVATSFATLTADIKADDSRAVLDTRQAFMPGHGGASFTPAGGMTNDAKLAMYEKSDKALGDRWKGTPPAAH